MGRKLPRHYCSEDDAYDIMKVVAYAPQNLITFVPNLRSFYCMLRIAND